MPAPVAAAREAEAAAALGSRLTAPERAVRPRQRPLGRAPDRDRSAPRPGARVQNLYVGLARSLWYRLRAEHERVRPERDRLIRTFQAHAANRQLTGKVINRLLAQWADLPGLGRLGLEIEQPAGGGLRLTELRCIPSRMTLEGWNEPELAIGLDALRIVYVPRREIAVKRDPLGDVCHHAVARRYERCRDRSDDAVLRDVAALVGDADRYLAAVGDGGDFAIPTPSGGTWIGERMSYMNRPFLSVRTYVQAAR
jgi:hypothetical protein